MVSSERFVVMKFSPTHIKKDTAFSACENTLKTAALDTSTNFAIGRGRDANKL